MARSRRKRGPDGLLYTAEQYKAKFGSNGSSSKEDKIEVKTPEKVSRDQKNQESIQEKSSSKEKENAPQIIITYIENGKRVQKTYVCDSLKLHESVDKEYLRSGPKTTLDIYIEGSVIEVM